MRQDSLQDLAVAAMFGSMLLLISPAIVKAQQDEPIGFFVVDVRGSLPMYGQNGQLAANEGLLSVQLPSRGIGIELGSHFYPVRWRWLTLGVGVSLLTSAGNRVPSEKDPIADGPTVKMTFTTASPQLSLNFGKREGWSYLSGGLGTSQLTIATEPAQNSGTQWQSRTINYGGGARWFVKKHLAFNMDLRFYSIRPLAATNTNPAMPRMKLVAFNVGVSFR